MIKIFLKELILFSALAIINFSCQKSFECECTTNTSTKSGGKVDNQTFVTTSTDKAKNQERARLECENVKSMSTSPSMTMESTCKLK